MSLIFLLRVLDLKAFHGMFEGFVGFLPSFSLPDIVQSTFNFALNRFRQFVQNVSCFMNPASLVFCFRPDFADGFPEPEGSITYGQHWCFCQPLFFNAGLEFFPTLAGFPVAIFDRYQLFPAMISDSNQHQNTLTAFF